MHSYRLVQIGDIHYSNSKSLLFQDKKDKAFPNKLAEETSIGPYRQALRAITKARDDGDGVKGIIFCGDLSTYGNYKEYQEAVESLKNTLSLDKISKNKNAAIIVVPGNHDIDRDKIDHSSDNFKEKFKTLEEAWNKIGCDFFKHNEINPTTIKLKKNSEVYLFPLNSCIGCGEKRCYPAPIRTALYNALEDYSKKNDEEVSFKLLGEDLDTPAFLENDIDYICDIILKSSEKTVPILVSHHNLLPQTIPRFDMYTELLNSGFVRSRLGKCSHPVLYCHAHVHSDPIEKIIDLRNNGQPVITISAPQIIEGFNIIEIKFNGDGFPLGCMIELHRISKDGHVDVKYKNIPFVTPNDSSYLMSQKSRDVYLDISSDTPYRYYDLLNHIKRTRKISKNVFSNCLVEAEWFGLLNIRNMSEQNKYWHIEKVVP